VAVSPMLVTGLVSMPVYETLDQLAPIQLVVTISVMHLEVVELQLLVGHLGGVHGNIQVLLHVLFLMSNILMKNFLLTMTTSLLLLTMTMTASLLLLTMTMTASLLLLIMTMTASLLLLTMTASLLLLTMTMTALLMIPTSCLLLLTRSSWLLLARVRGRRDRTVGLSWHLPRHFLTWYLSFSI